MTLETWLKIHTNVYNFVTASNDQSQHDLIYRPSSLRNSEMANSEVTSIEVLKRDMIREL